MKHKCTGWVIVATMERPDGTWYDETIQEWIDKCPEHDNELIHSDDNGIVIVVRFNNEKEE